MLQPYARVLFRGRDRVQVGLVSGRGVLLSGLTPADVALVTLLGAGADLPTLVRRAHRDGGRLDDLLDALRPHGLLNEDPGDRAALACLHPETARSAAHEALAWSAAYGLGGDGLDLVAERSRRHLVVHGSGALTEAVVRTLREAGIGRLTCGSGVDLHELAWRAGESSPPDAVVLVGVGAVSFEAAEPWRRRGVPHLPVVLDGPRLAVGPWVGPTDPCLTCVDLHRSDLDAGWPQVLRQLVHAHDRPAEGDACLRSIAAGLVAALLLPHLDGRDTPVPGTSIEVALPLLGPVRRRWTPHPRCRCDAARGTLVT
ncbi:hypothetical protein [Agilicoccus flavus]|uniref:hypothetical protein n=1 Tax=Agilicoccus flavus TaxID=2775968 RepID=UPI001CF6E69E|nr:hypothetical protein [Agilicoccus flavus]